MLGLGRLRRSELRGVGAGGSYHYSGSPACPAIGDPWGPSPLTLGTWDCPPAPLWESQGPRIARPGVEVVALGRDSPFGLE